MRITSKRVPCTVVRAPDVQPIRFELAGKLYLVVGAPDVQPISSKVYLFIGGLQTSSRFVAKVYLVVRARDVQPIPDGPDSKS